MSTNRTCVHPPTRAASLVKRDFPVVFRCPTEKIPSNGCFGNPIMPSVTRTGLSRWKSVPLDSLIQFRENVQTRPIQVNIMNWTCFPWKKIRKKNFLNQIKWVSFRCCFWFLSGNVDEICKQNPKAILRKMDNCAQYFNCSVRNSQYGGHLQECSYPDLFSTVSMKCEDFKTVTCDNRTEPQAPCEPCNYN